MEQADTVDSKSIAFGRAGSSPVVGTNFISGHSAMAEHLFWEQGGVGSNPVARATEQLTKEDYKYGEKNSEKVKNAIFFGKWR